MTRVVGQPGRANSPKGVCAGGAVWYLRFVRILALPGVSSRLHRLSLHTIVLGLAAVAAVAPLTRQSVKLIPTRPTASLHAPAQAQAPAPAPGQLFAAAVSFNSPRATVATAPDIATIDVPGIGGTFTVPYIQTGPDLAFSLDVRGIDGPARVEVWLDAGRPEARSLELSSAPWSGTFTGIAFGEHTLDARAFRLAPVGFDGLTAPASPVATTHLNQVARGDIVAALGDSTTEGIGGKPISDAVANALHFFPDWTAAASALNPVDPTLVSADGRNFPQPGGTAHIAPSFTVQLARTLADQRKHPVLVLNDGWSGTTADGYVGITTSDLLKRQTTIARPAEWLVNLGVNDALVHRSPDEYKARMQTLVQNLEQLHGALPDQIHVACPSYATQPDRHDLEQAYLPVIDQLRTTMDLAAGPDLFSSYRDHPGWIEDAVHPSAEGYSAMAQLWADALAGRGAACGG